MYVYVRTYGNLGGSTSFRLWNAPLKIIRSLVLYIQDSPMCQTSSLSESWWLLLKTCHAHTLADPTPTTGGDEVATEPVEAAGTGEATKKKKKKKKKGGASSASDDYLHPLSNPTGTVTTKDSCENHSASPYTKTTVSVSITASFYGTCMTTL